MPKLTKRALDAERAAGGADRFLWCSELRGVGVRIGAHRCTFVLQYRNAQQRSKRISLGVYGPMTVEQARAKALKLLAAIQGGADPAASKRETRHAMTLTELAALYQTACEAGAVLTRFGRPKAKSTIENDRTWLAKHILPALGSGIASELTRADVQRAADTIAAGSTPATATRATELLGGLWSWAERRGYVAGVNPVRGVEKHVARPRDRVLSATELHRLGDTLKEMRDHYPMARAALRLLALTGLRQNEAVRLRWPEIDATGTCLHLQETKTGRSTRPLARLAYEHLNTLPRVHDEFVFGGGELKKQIAKVFDAAGLHDARSQTLRRTFASSAAELGYGDATIAEMLGHARRGVTERHYVRRPDTVLIEAASRTAELIDARLNGREAAVITMRQAADNPPANKSLPGAAR